MENKKNNKKPFSLGEQVILNEIRELKKRIEEINKYKKFEEFLKEK